MKWSEWVRTTEIAWFVCVVLVSAVFCRGADALTLTIDNQSGFVIIFVHAAPDYAPGSPEYLYQPNVNLESGKKRQFQVENERDPDHCSYTITILAQGGLFRSFKERDLCDDPYVIFDAGRGFYVHNESRTTIEAVLASPNFERGTGPNRLPVVIDPGLRLDVMLDKLFNDTCVFDIRLMTRSTVVDYRRQNLCEERIFRVMFFEGNELTIANEGEEIIKRISVSYDHDHERHGWRYDLLAGTLLPGKEIATRLHQFMEEQCLFDILVEDDGGQHVYEDVDVCNTARLVHPRRSDGGAPTAPVVPREDLTVGETFQDCEGWGCPWMVVVDGGAFERGSKERDEAPVTKVTVPGPFAVGEFEVSVGQFEEFARDTGHDGGNACYIKARRGWRLKKGRGEWHLTEGRSWGEPGFDQDDSHPVVCVSWDDAIAYTRWLAGRTAMPYRLLTEAEAEWLATASATNFERSGRANCRNCGSPWDGKGTSPIGRMPPDDLGLHDVFGNAAEWVQDCYQSGYGNAHRDGSAWSPPSCERRVVRGGCWLTSAQKLRASGRDSGEPDRRSSCVGFRVARDLGKE